MAKELLKVKFDPRRYNPELKQSFAEMRHQERIEDHVLCSYALLHGLLEQWQRLREAPGQGIGICQERGDPGE